MNTYSKVAHYLKIANDYDIGKVPSAYENEMIQYQKNIDMYFTDTEVPVQNIETLPVFANEISSVGRVGDMTYYIDEQNKKIYQVYPDAGILTESTDFENAKNSILKFKNWVMQFA